MSRYRRWYVPGGTYFFTVVTCRRRPLFHAQFARDALRDAIDATRKKYPFTVTAMVLLPEHVHSVWTLPPGDANYSLRWRLIKDAFTKRFLREGGGESWQSSSRKRQGFRGVWQRRFWEHTCRDEVDLKRCVDYIHWNPKKHGLVENVRDWPWSTFHRFIEAGEYAPAWGAVDPSPGYDDPEWGE